MAGADRSTPRGPLEAVMAKTGAEIHPAEGECLSTTCGGPGHTRIPAPFRQPKVFINLDLPSPGALRPGSIDPWLAFLAPGLAAAAGLSADAGQPLVVQWLRRVMLLAREILQVAAIPVFDEFDLVSCATRQDQPGSLRAVIAVPMTDHVPVGVHDIAFGVAFRVVGWMMATQPTDEGRQKLFAALSQDAIEPIRKIAPSGKSTMHVLRAAHASGIPFRSLGGGVYQFGWGARRRLVDRSATDRDSVVGARLSQSKALSARALHLAGLPAPVHEVVTDIAAARAVAERLGWPVVVKPVDCDRGEGVSVDVDPARLEQAFAEAQRVSPAKHVIVERQVEGVCHRLFLASGRLLYAVKRLPIGVRGDGIRSVEALVAAELAEQAGRPPWRRSALCPIDDLARGALAAAGLEAASVPEAGRFVPLRRIESTAWGGVDEDVTEIVHPENLRAASAAAELIGLDIAGIDIISPDISTPWHRNGAVIGEVNFAPLLGEGEISRRHLGAFLARLLDGDGRIPVEVFAGGEAAWRAALDRRDVLGGDGAGVFVTSADATLDGEGREIPMPFKSLYRRARALLLSSKVQALLLVAQDTEWLSTGLPVDRIDGFVVVDATLRQHRNPAQRITPEEDRRLRALIQDHLRQGG
jgi:cyanophycin synthetase